MSNSTVNSEFLDQVEDYLIKSDVGVDAASVIKIF